METAEVLYTRSFSAFEPVQAEHILQYSITQEEKEPESDEPESAENTTYGVRIASLTHEGKKAETCRGVCGTFEQANQLLRFLWENSVEPGAVKGVVQDLHRAIDLSQKKTEMSGKHE